MYLPSGGFCIGLLAPLGIPRDRPQLESRLNPWASIPTHARGVPDSHAGAALDHSIPPFSSGGGGGGVL